MEKHDQLYFNLLLTWHQSAMAALGKINNPVTGKIPVTTATFINV